MKTPDEQAWADFVTRVKESLPEGNTSFAGVIYDSEEGSPTLDYRSFIRAMFYDACISDPEDVLAEMGIQAVSDDVQAMVREDSDKRLERVGEALAVVKILSYVIATGLVGYLDHQNNHELSPEQIEAAMSNTFLAGSAVGLAAVSLLVDLGMLVPAEEVNG